MSPKILSRNSIISFIAVGVLAAATLASGAAQAHHSGGPGGHPGGHPGHWGHWGHYRHYVHFHDRVYVRPVSYAVRTPGPCTCLTKNYTPEGRVVFQDLCTKEMASAPADGSSDQTQNEQGPANMAGQSYQDYLKANPQAAQTQKN